MVLTQNSQNSIYLTLSENVTLTGTTYFLFKFKSETTNDSFLFTAPDISTATTRYNEFQLTLTGSSYTNLTAGTIDMRPDGRWTYEVYEMTGQTNLSIANTTGIIIEKGLISLTGTSTHNIINESYTGTTSSYNYYTGMY